MTAIRMWDIGLLRVIRYPKGQAPTQHVTFGLRGWQLWAEMIRGDTELRWNVHGWHWFERYSI